VHETVQVRFPLQMKNESLRWQLREHETRLVITSISTVDSVIFQKSLSQLLFLQLRPAIDTDSERNHLGRRSQLKINVNLHLIVF
jgi:hypothetical protein